ncbi:MAG: DEAD/DEAH box helicase [Ignavibacteria bacterium]|nr:DEAD/DEAH box helicase [Ignavibacteria bacterium]
MLFEDLNLLPPLLKAVTEEGYTTPTPIQTQAIPVILEQKDVIGCAKTGTGKTAAFAIPILQLLYPNRITGKGYRHIKALILTPTRELAIQIADSFTAYGRHTGVKNTVVFGGVSQKSQVDKLKFGVDVLIATPGRLIDLVNQNILSLNQVETFVLDEADRMLDMGFIHDIKKVVSFIPAKRQTLLFSATMPAEIINLANSLLHNPVHISVSPDKPTVEAINQQVYYVAKSDKRSLLVDVLKDKEIESALVFTRTKYGADKVARILSRAKINALSIHGDKTQGARQNALDQFKRRKIRVLVATDIAARGLDIDELSHVINYEIPPVPETYVHRIGRTGRAGASGVAISFCDTEEKSYLQLIQKTLSQKIPVIAGHKYASADSHTEVISPATVKEKMKTPAASPASPKKIKKFKFRKHAKPTR